MVVETSAGRRLMKLRGAAQGTGPLVAEIIVAELADSLGLAVPERSLIELPAKIETADWDDELADLLAASVGLNLGFDFLAGARDFAASDLARVGPGDRAAILWLDRFTLNPDRTRRNPNLLWWSDRFWLIDHGATLRFQYAWRRVSETSPREPGLAPDAHLFEAAVADLHLVDAALASRVTHDVLEAAVAAVPESFLLPLLSPPAASAGAASELMTLRAAYVAFLWNRLRAPRLFIEPRPSM